MLLETGQHIPDFLSHFKPEDAVLNFDEEEEPDYELDAGAGDVNGDTNGEAWGSGDANGAPAAEMGAGDAWGTGGTQDAWGANNDTGAAGGYAGGAAW